MNLRIFRVLLQYFAGSVFIAFILYLIWWSCQYLCHWCHQKQLNRKIFIEDPNILTVVIIQ